MMRKALFLPAFLTLIAFSAFAQGDDPPSWVARLNYQSGSVSFRPGSVEEWTSATLNYPLTSGDHLWADAGAQTEMHVGSTAIRMSSLTAMSFLNLDDRSVQLSLTQGSLNIRIRNLAEDEMFEVDTPNVAVTLLRAGDYRIDADGDKNETFITVRGGDAAVTGGGASFSVHPRESARLTGIETVSQEVGGAPPPDQFDSWCEMRERREAQAQISARYVPRDMVGYEDLDEYGVWSESPQYGWVWRPRAVEAGWAPYHYGHWAWVEPWGWTWIDDAPWGFAPFHYGRWAFAGAGWVWVPGRMVVGVRPVYAPALVAFVGGPRFGAAVAIGVGGVAAWFPLGPGEVYRPAYHVSEVYVRQVNITHVTNINVVNVRYVNQNVQGAVMAVPYEAFVTARPVMRASIRIDTREVAQAQVVGTTAMVAPRRESVLAHGGPVVAAPPARFAERPVFVKTRPPAPPVPFAAKQQALQANQGRPLEPAQVNSLRSNVPALSPMVRTAAPTPGYANPQNRPALAPRQPEPRETMQPRSERPVPLERRSVDPAPRGERPVTIDRPAPAQQHEAAPRERGERPEKKGEKKKEEKKEKKDREH
ncbi:MAG TPA: DUF6600 domain-containing protein [Bryobacteraceae bacterium]